MMATSTEATWSNTVYPLPELSDISPAVSLMTSRGNMPAVTNTETASTAASETVDFDALIKWMESKHNGFKSKLIAKDIPGAGRGLFAAEKINAGETILEIPATALLNPLTLASSGTDIPDYLFPLSNAVSARAHTAKRAKTTRRSGVAEHTNRLNTTQLLTLYLALNRDPKAAKSSPWAKYLDTLPKSFAPWHPLTWYYREGYEGWWKTPLGLLPVSARLKLEDVKRRYEEDAAVLKDILTQHDPFKARAVYPNKVTDDTLLWAWLNVNTRTVSIPLDLPGVSALNNHTMVPILDMLNHSSKPDEIIPKPIQYPSSSSAGNGTGPTAGPSRRGAEPHLIPGKIGFRLIAPERGLEKDEQVRFEYGAHSTETLFTEYGFTPEEKYGDWLGQPNGEVDVNDLMEKMCPIRQEKVRSTLEEMGCWQRNMIYAFPKPVHASRGLVMTLRLFHLSKIKTKRNAEVLEETRIGMDSYLDVQGVESGMRKSLIELCAKVWEESDRRCSDLGRASISKLSDGTMLDTYDVPPGQGDASDMSAAMDVVQRLWSERKAIARKLKTGIAAGQRIWD